MRSAPLMIALLFFSIFKSHAEEVKLPVGKTPPSSNSDLPNNSPSISKEQADALINEGKQAMVESNDNPRRSVDAAVAFSKALKYYEKTDQTEKVCDLEANIFWCKKRMNIDDVKAFVAQKSGDKSAIEALDKATQVATKEVSMEKANEYFDRAEKFAAENPEKFDQISVRFFEVAERFVGTPTGIKAQKLSLGAQQKQLAAIKAEEQAQRATVFSKPSSVSKSKQTEVPSSEAQKLSLATIRSLFKEDFAKKKPTQKNNLMVKIYEQALATKDDPTMQYSLLTLSVDLGMECQQYAKVIEACDLMGENFTVVDVKELKRTVFSKVKNPTASIIFKLLDEPQNGEANTTAGKYFCYEEKRWDLGIPMLLNGADTDLKKLAEMENLKPDGAAQQVEIGDRWYDIGKKGSKLSKEGPMSRALFWYQLASSKITGISKERIAKRLDEIDSVLPMTNLDYDNLTAKQWDRLKGNVVTGFVGKDRKDIGLTLQPGTRYRIVPHPTDVWQWNDYYSNYSSDGTQLKEVNYKGLIPPKSQAGSSYHQDDNSINQGALVMQVENGNWMKPGLIQGNGRVYLGPYAGRYSSSLGGKGEIRCKILTVTEE